jgi:FkbM family methyltransferase
MKPVLRGIKANGILWFFSSVRLHVFPRLLVHYLRPEEATSLVRLGTDYGGWWIPVSVLRPGVVAYCAGAGEDISFDIALHDRGLRVVTLDPTPRAVSYVSATAPKDDRFVFVPKGVWDEATSLRFYAPRDPKHVSHSIVNHQHTTDYFVAEVEPLRMLMDELGDTTIDILKLDIEGAEHRVIQSILEDGVKPRVICVEFDQPSPINSVIQTVRRLQRSQYQLLKIDWWNYTFVRAE